MFAPILERKYRKHMIPHSKDIKELSLPLAIPGSPLSFPRLIEDFSLNGERMIREEIKSFLEKMDRDFRNSPGRTRDYYVNNTRQRTIITMFGEITYTRTIYRDRLNGRIFCYVDERLGIERYTRYTNDVASYAAEAYSDENSMIKVGIELGNLIYSKFSLCDNRIHLIPRQTIYNLLSRVKQIRIVPDEEKKKSDIIYVLMDEKYLPDHSKTDEDGNRVKSSKMSKAALICEGLDKSDPNRHRYLNCSYFSLHSGDFSQELISFINDRYDLSCMKNISVLADGANWIKAVAEELNFPKVETKQYLCRFHFHQALWRIFRDKDLYDKALDYLYHQDKKDLDLLMKSVKEERNEKDISYIDNNWDLIVNTIHLKGMNCAMEQCISHHIHSQFDNVPKVYSSDNLNRYLSFRDNYRSKENMKYLYLEALKDKDSGTDKTVIRKTPLDLSHFDDQIPLPYYTTALNSGKNPVVFKPHDDYRFIF